MAVIIPIASGKGGVGKSAIASNLGIAMANSGKTVVLVDLDLGSSNLHTFLGMKNRNNGLGQYIYKQEQNFDALLNPTDFSRLYLITGDSLLPGTANLQFFMKRKILKELSKLVADYVILDLGSGTAFNVVDFFITSDSGIIVTTPETTAILNAYSFVKTAVYRLMFRSFPYKSEERKIIKDFLTTKIEGNDNNLDILFSLLEQYNPGSAETARKAVDAFHPKIILNIARTQHDVSLGKKLENIVNKNLNMSIENIGYIEMDDIVNLSVMRRTPAIVLNPQSGFSRSVSTIANILIGQPDPNQMAIYVDEDEQEMLSI